MEELITTAESYLAKKREKLVPHVRTATTVVVLIALALPVFNLFLWRVMLPIVLLAIFSFILFKKGKIFSGELVLPDDLLFSIVQNKRIPDLHKTILAEFLRENNGIVSFRDLNTVIKKSKERETIQKRMQAPGVAALLDHTATAQNPGVQP